MRTEDDASRRASDASRSWETFPHGSDIGVRGRGRTLEEAFEGAALALVSVVTDPDRVEPRVAVAIECGAPDPELLLVEWLDQLIWEMATRRMLFGQVQVSIEDGRLTARVLGEPVDRERHEPAVEVKGPTVTELAVRRAADGTWSAQCVVDV